MGATLLTALLLQQKLINEEFQVEPRNWRDHLQKKNAEVWRAYRENNGATTRLSGSRLSSRPEGAKTQELRQLIEHRIGTMTHADMVNLTSATLDQHGTVMTAVVPDISSVPSGSYWAIVRNVMADGSLQFLGAADVFVG